jgi:hypothetical protein
MDADQPGLFDLPGAEPQAIAQRRQRGRNREVWALTATAEVTIIDASLLRAAATRLNEGFVITVPSADDAVDDTESETADAVRADDVFDALAFAIWPDEGLQEALEAGAVRILSVESAAASDSADQGTATWKITVKLTGIDEFRRLATQASPDESAEISESLPLAWQRAADPFAPLRLIAGISWSPGRVTVEHLPVRAAQDR